MTPCPPIGGRTIPNIPSVFLNLFLVKPPLKKNDFGYDWLPKVDDGTGYSWFDLFDAMYKNKINGLFAWGQNPACSGSNASKIRESMGKSGLDGQR